jgi:acyl-CoA synthetase (AMP-forming)/AMP-acid ligase II
MSLNPARAAKVLADAGVIRPYRPSRLLRLGGTLLSWGTGPAAGSISLAARFPDAVGLIDDLGQLTFDEIHRRSNAVARGLTELGVGEGDVVAVMCRNHRYFVEASFAAARLGADVLYLNTSFAGPQLVDVLERERPRLVLYDEEFADLVESFDPTGTGVARALAWTEDGTIRTRDGRQIDTCESFVAGQDDSDLRSPERESRSTILTSGTTGAPRGASRAAGGLDAAVSLLSRLPLKTRWSTHIAAPMFHTWGWAHFQLGLLLGSTMVLTRRFEPERCMQLVEGHHCESLVVIPVMLQRILDAVGPDGEAPASYDVSSLHAVAASGSALPGDLSDRWMDAYGDTLYNIYGSTECAWATIATPEDLRAAPGTAGMPPLGTEVALFDDADEPVPVGAAGRIFVRNSMLFEGYSGGGSKDRIGELMATGDVGHYDEAGRLFIEGRDDDMIVSGGENVFPQEVEDLLSRHEAVADVAAIGVEDDEFGQRLRAFVVRKAPTSQTDDAMAEDELTDVLKEHVGANLAGYKVPRDFVYVPELPRNATGKILKSELATYDEK